LEDKLKKLILALALVGAILGATPKAEAFCIDIGGGQYCF